MLHIARFFLFLLLVGCAIPPVHHWAQSVIGQDINKFKRESPPDSYASRIGWKETTYSLENGNWVYVYPIRANCYVHFEVNPQGVIVGFKNEGTACY